MQGRSGPQVAALSSQEWCCSAERDDRRLVTALWGSSLERSYRGRPWIACATGSSCGSNSIVQQHHQSASPRDGLHGNCGCSRETSLHPTSPASSSLPARVLVPWAACELLSREPHPQERGAEEGSAKPLRTTASLLRAQPYARAKLSACARAPPIAPFVHSLKPGTVSARRPGHTAAGLLALGILVCRTLHN